MTDRDDLPSFLYVAGVLLTYGLPFALGVIAGVLWHAT
jgi:hypothetical protein